MMRPSQQPPSFSQVPAESVAGDESLALGLLRVIVYAIVAVIGLALAWGLLTYLTHKIYFQAATIIGLLIALSLTSAFKRLTLPVFLLISLPTILLTGLTVMLGDYFFYVLSAIREYGVSPLNAIIDVAANFLEIEFGQSSDGMLSLLMGGLGSLFGIFVIIRRRA
jgi:hypothetical protein